ncbi:hypothetical protein [Nostoc sp.]
MFSTGCSVTHLGGSRVSHASLKVLLYKHSSDKLREATVHGAIGLSPKRNVKRCVGERKATLEQAATVAPTINPSKVEGVKVIFGNIKSDYATVVNILYSDI